MKFADVMPDGTIVGFYDPAIHVKSIPATAQPISDDEWRSHLSGDLRKFDATKNKFRKETDEEKKTRRDEQDARPENVKARAEHNLRQALEKSIPHVIAWIVGDPAEQTKARAKLQALYADIVAARDKLKSNET